MASQGPNSCGVGSSDGDGDYPWLTPNEITTSNDTYARAVFDPFIVDSFSDHLRCENFNFTIPAGSTIDGILVEIEKRADAEYVTDYNIQLLKAGVKVGDNKADYPAEWAAEGYVSYGGASDPWGTTWTVAEVTSEHFGVAIQVQNLVGGEIGYVDHVRITVYYTPGAVTGAPLMALIGVGA